MLCRLLNISASNTSSEPIEPTTPTPGQETSMSSRPGYTKQVSVAELFGKKLYFTLHPLQDIFMYEV